MLFTRGSGAGRVFCPALVGQRRSSRPASNRWTGVKRPYGPQLVNALRGSVYIEYSLARRGAELLWADMCSESGGYVSTMGAVTGSQAVQMVKCGLNAIYCSGWQVAGDNNSAMETYPDQSLYPVDSVPRLVQRINNALLRADQVAHVSAYRLPGWEKRNYVVPVVADAEAGFGGPLNAYELTRNMIKSGAAGVHFEDQLSSEKKCGHMGGKVLIPTSTFMRQLAAARLAADVMDVPTVIIGRTDAESAKLLSSDHDCLDRQFITGSRTEDGFYRIKSGLDYAIARAVQFAPYCDVVWCETSKPDITFARHFAAAVRHAHPGKLLAYNCSSSFNWRKFLNEDELRSFQQDLAELGFKFQFITLAGFHSINNAMFHLAQAYRDRGMAAYAEIQDAEFEKAKDGYTAHKHQQEVGAGYYDIISSAVSECVSHTSSLVDSTEQEQFQDGRTSVQS